MTMMKKLAAALTLALTLSGAFAPAAHAGYWEVYCDYYGCWEVYVETCDYWTDGWYWYESCY